MNPPTPTTTPAPMMIALTMILNPTMSQVLTILNQIIPIPRMTKKMIPITLGVDVSYAIRKPMNRFTPQ